MNGLKICKMYGPPFFFRVIPTYQGLPSLTIADTKLSNNKMNSIANTNVNFTDVIISNSSLTGIEAYRAVLTVRGNLTLYGNTGKNGGGMSLYSGSRLILLTNSILNFSHNSVSNKGGGLYSDLGYFVYCLISAPNQTDVSVYFINNTAPIGSDTYGTNVNTCKHKSILKTDVKQSTDPVKMCFCENSTYNGCLSSHSLLPRQDVFPGQFVNFSVTLWGYGYNTMSITNGSITLQLNDEFVDLKYVGPNCSVSSYKPNFSNSSSNQKLMLLLESDLTIISNPPSLSVPFSILPCPIGFILSPVEDICTCSSSITAENVTCHIDTLQITRNGQLWIGPYNTSITFNADQPNHHNICFISEKCFFCNPSNVSFVLNDTDPQCQQHKSGTLCGSCTTGYSLVLGTNECMECTTNYNIALIILFAFMGIAFVVLLIVLNLTVSVGTINGLLFTANIIKLYQPVFLGNQIPIPFFSQIISWINLDFGIQMCFYNGMDRYIKEWLQFAFPFYVWAIIIVIILICRVSSKVSRLVGSNAVPVLATLLLLSYTKLLLTIVAVLHKRDITLHCQNFSHQLTVWYEDPTLQYAKGKHLYLFSFALIMLILFCLPYTLFLLLNPLFEKYLTKYRPCRYWYKIIKPFIDAYSGPMKDEYRFWPGVLVVARIPVLLAVLLVNNVIQFRSLLLSILLSVLVVMWSLTYCFQRVYNNRLHNFIETWFIFMLTAMVALAVASINMIYTAIWYNVSISVVTCSFFGIIVYHIHLKFNKKDWYISRTNKIKTLFESQKEEMAYEEIKEINDTVSVTELQFLHDESVVVLF